MGLFKKKDGTKRQPLKKIGKAIKKVAVKTSQGVKKVSQKVAATAKKVANKGKEVAMLALFAPLSPLARTFLKRRGVQPANDLKALAVQVQNERSKKSFGYLPGGDAFDYSLTTLDEYGYYDHLGIEHADFGMVPLTPEILMGVISFLKGIFNSIKEKRAKGEKLSADEQAIADQAGEIEAALEDAKTQAGEIADESDKKADDILTGKNVKILIAVVVLIVLFLLFRKKLGM